MDGQNPQSASSTPALTSQTVPTPSTSTQSPLTTNQPVTPTAPPPSPPSPSASVSGETTSTLPPKKNSHKLLFIILIILILVIAGLVAYKVYITKVSESMYQDAYKISPTVTPIPTVTSSGSVRSGDTQIDQQSDIIDESMNKLTEDLKNVDQGLSDQSINVNQ